MAHDPIPSVLSAQVVSPDRLDDRDIDFWNRLTTEDPALASPFLSHAYASAAARVFDGVRVCRIIKDGRTAGFFAFQYRSRLHRLLRIGERIGGELSDYFGIVAEPSLAVTPATLLALTRLNALYFTHLDETQLRHGLSGEKPEPGLRIRIPADEPSPWEVLRQRDKKFVSDTERRERKLVQEHGPLHFVFRQPDPLPRLHELVTAKRAQYARTAADDLLQSAATRHFLEQLALSADPRCHGTLSTLHAGNTWVASHFGLMHGGTLHYWFPAYNPALKSFSPGRLLMASIIRSAPETGVTCVDRGSGENQAKRDFATERHCFRRGIWQRWGVSTAIYRAGLSFGWRLRASSMVRTSADGE